MMTSKALTAMGVHHFVIAEPQEVAAYREASRKLAVTVLELDMEFKRSYNLCDEFGLSKSTGPGPARNFAWAHSLAAGHTHHWVMDDNIAYFCRYNRNTKIKLKTPAFWRSMEDFVLRYSNVAMSGPNYEFFAPSRYKIPAFITNTRIYSCNLIRNDLPFRWRGRYNEDTILSLDMLKAGWCTIQFNAFLQKKTATQQVAGGNTAEFYAKEGTAPKSAMLKKIHPDATTLVFKFNRHHHHIDYKRFKQQLLRRPDAELLSHAGLEIKLVKKAKKNDSPSATR
jgi:hypothetical protein